MKIKIREYLLIVIFAAISAPFTYIIIALLLFPLLNGEALNPTIRLFTLKAASIILLPIAFYHYSQKGDVSLLIRSAYLFVVFYALYIIIKATHKILQTNHLNFS